MSAAKVAMNDATRDERVRNQPQLLPEGRPPEQRRRRSRLSRGSRLAASLTARERSLSERFVLPLVTWPFASNVVAHPGPPAAR